MHAALLANWFEAATGPASSTSPWLTPVAGLAGVVVGAFIAGGFRLRGDKVARRADAQRRALYELQDGMLTLRTALQDYGNAAPRPGKKVTRALDAANGQVDVLTQRVERAQLRLDVQEWRAVAQRYWLEDETVTSDTENTAWLRIHYRAGTELRLLDRSLIERGRP